MLKFHNIHEAILALYIVLDAIMIAVTIGLHAYLALLLAILYVIISWLTFKRKTVKRAINSV